MKFTTGFLKVVCAWTVILLPSLEAKKHAAGASCRPKELTALTKRLIEKCLTSFEEANGKHLGTWAPGFPELQVHRDTPLVSSKVQCSLHFMAQGLGEVLEDQRSNLNPNNYSLHRELAHIISQTNMLTKCVRQVLGGECSSKPNPPKMPVHAFERKQWSHTLLETAKDYLGWLGHTIQVQVAKVKGTNSRKVIVAMHQKYFEGSGYPL